MLVAKSAKSGLVVYVVVLIVVDKDCLNFRVLVNYCITTPKALIPLQIMEVRPRKEDFQILPGLFELPLYINRGGYVNLKVEYKKMMLAKILTIKIASTGATCYSESSGSIRGAS